jgi:two-component system, NarL family, nitrate/nitrite response regulator NarL
MTIRCLIVDDSAQFTQVATELLEEEGVEVVGAAIDGEEAVRVARAVRPDLALVDIDLGEDNGLAVARRLCGGDHDRLAGAVILISTHDEEQFAELIAASPAVGFLAKSDLSAAAIEGLLGRNGHAPAG